MCLSQNMKLVLIARLSDWQRIPKPITFIVARRIRAFNKGRLRNQLNHRSHSQQTVKNQNLI